MSDKKSGRKKIRKDCEWCGRPFLTTNSRRKTCSKKCRIESTVHHCDTKGQICWRCQNSTGRCSWSRELKPVEGWVAEPTIVRNKEGKVLYSSYKIIFCPEFLQD